jgi:hypothetical protein
MTRALLTARIDAEAVPKGAKTRRAPVVPAPDLPHIGKPCRRLARIKSSDISHKLFRLRFDAGPRSLSVLKSGQLCWLQFKEIHVQRT